MRALDRLASKTLDSLGSQLRPGGRAARRRRRRRAVVARDQGRAVAAIGDGPLPAEVRDSGRVGPRHVIVDEAVGAVVLAELAGDDRNALRDARDERPAGRDAAGRPVLHEFVRVERRHELPRRVGGPVGEPLREVAGVVEPADQHRLLGARRADSVEQTTASRPCATAGGAAVAPAGPGDVVGLVVEVEDDRPGRRETRSRRRARSRGSGRRRPCVMIERPKRAGRVQCRSRIT